MALSVILTLPFLVAVLSSSALARPHDGPDSDVVKAALPGTWYHTDDHPVHNLFRRGGDGTTYAAIGTTEWSAGFPSDNGAMPADGKGYPQVWIDALNAAVKAGKIPDIPQSTVDNDTGFTSYPKGYDPNGPVVCSATYQCRSNDSSEIWDAPDGVFASSFDDGPLPTSFALYDFLKQNNVTATHFMIGGNIRDNPDAFKMAFEDLQDDIAVHTWTHPYMTSLNNLQVVGELGWTMQLIHNSTGGRVPKYWRPPFGDSDERVRSIAKEVFGLTTVIWNQDTEDWSIGEANGATRAQVDANLKKWISGAKSPGLIILEHELTNNTVGAFIQAFPLIAQNGWKFESVARIDGGAPYQNAADSASDVVPMTVGGAAVQLLASSTSSADASTSSAASSSAAASSPSGTGKNAAADANNGALSPVSRLSSLGSVAAAAAAALALSC